MTLKDLIATDIPAVAINTDEFAEVVTYFPEGAAARELNATCEQSQQAELDENGSERVLDELRVFCLRDADATDGGIAAPEIGERLLRSSTIDPRQRPYQFNGQIEEADAVAWLLTFTREHRTAHAARS
jgi:hypothetical protein